MNWLAAVREWSRGSAHDGHTLGMLYRAQGNAPESVRCLEQARRLGGVTEQRTISGLPGSRSAAVPPQP